MIIITHCHLNINWCFRALKRKQQALSNTLFASEYKTTLKYIYIYVPFLRFQYKLLPIKLQAFYKSCNNIGTNQLGPTGGVTVDKSLNWISLWVPPYCIEGKKRMSLTPQTVLLNPNQATEVCAVGLMYSINKIQRANQLLNAFTPSLLANGSKHVLLMVGLFKDTF